MKTLRNLFAILASFSLFSVAYAQEAEEATSMLEKAEHYFGVVTGPFVGFIFSSITIPGTEIEFLWIVGWLVIGAVVFTVYFGFIQLSGVKHSIDLLKGKYSDPNDAGEVSHFQALATALSGTVGLGVRNPRVVYS
ncbi:hypothetical protein [Ostreibacterium oceani]|uniref:hypothetical protein n=1 Tax=Ostreibacterium oceani TaxID=2654998 RepID=UPI001C401C07|nr:hypothetical protein [Ostreibacterium oceani]